MRDPGSAAPAVRRLRFAASVKDYDLCGVHCPELPGFFLSTTDPATGQVIRDQEPNTDFGVPRGMKHGSPK